MCYSTGLSAMELPPDVRLHMSILNEKGTKVEREASVSSVQVNLAAELIDLLPERQEGCISHSAVSLHMQLGLGRWRNAWTLQRSKCFLLSVSFIKGRPG